MRSSDKHKDQLLMIVSRFPYPLDKGDKLRAYYQAKELSKKFRLTLYVLSEKEVSEKDRKEVEKICDELVIFRINWFSKIFNMLRSFLKKEPLQVGYFYHSKAKKEIHNLIQSNSFRHIYCQLIRTSELCKNIHHIPKTLDYMDALSKGVERRINRQPFFIKWIFQLEAKRLKEYEQSIFDYFEFKTIISNQDKQLIFHPDRDKIIPIPNGIDNQFFQFPSEKKEYDFVFVGNMSYPPNIDAVHYIVKNILPNISGSTLLISGSSPSSSVQELAKNSPNITITGWVDDIRSSYAKGRIFLAPMMIGTGMQNKLLEAMAMGIPCITTKLANNAIGAKDKEEILVGESKSEFLNLITTLQNDDGYAQKIAQKGKEFVKSRYSWEKSVDDFVLQTISLKAK